jgi:SAM-dependent methyltransferase
MILAVDPDPAIRGVSIRASADDLPITTESCDVVLIFTSLQCVDDPARSLREASRVLRKGGLLVISEHQAWHCYGPWDRYRFTREGLTHLGRYAGLSVRSVLPLGSFWARTGIRLNRAILPYASSKWNRITPFLAPLLAFNNLLFGLLDRIWKLDGEAVGHIAIYEKPRGVGVS